MAVIGEGVDVVDGCLPAASADLTSTVAIDICQQGELEPRRGALIDDLKRPRMRLRRVLLVAKGAHVQVEVLVGGRSGG
jgi:hypothetical protein